MHSLRGRRLRRGAVRVGFVPVASYAVAWRATPCSGIARAVAWLEADTGDIARFPARTVEAGDDPWALEPAPGVAYAERGLPGATTEAAGRAGRCSARTGSPGRPPRTCPPRTVPVPATGGGGGGGDAPRHVSARGNLGQYVVVLPDLDLVMVRLGSAYGIQDWPRVFEQLAPPVRLLISTATATEQPRWNSVSTPSGS